MNNLVNGGQFTVHGTPCHKSKGAQSFGKLVNGMGIYLLLSYLLLGIGCVQDQTEHSRTYLFLGHPYDWNDGYRLDPRLEQLDFTKFDGIWLGGDVCSRTTDGPKAMNYLDSLLDFSSGNIQWTLGNHDVLFGDLERITNKTGKRSFYTTKLEGGITLLVLNTNLFWMYASRPVQENCEEKQAQLDLIQSVLDTIESSSHLVVLHHHALLKNYKPDSLRNAFNTNPDRVTITCDSSDQFDRMVYPQLVEVQNRGVQVVLVGGDVGMRAKQFSYRTPAGIWMLGSGINNSLKRENAPEYVTNFDRDQILLLKHLPEEQELSWEFVDLDDYLE